MLMINPERESSARKALVTVGVCMIASGKNKLLVQLNRVNSFLGYSLNGNCFQ